MKEAFYHLNAGEVHQADEIDGVVEGGPRRLSAWSATAHIGEGGLVAHVIGTGIGITDRRGVGIRLQRLQAQLAGQIQGDRVRTGKMVGIEGEPDRLIAELYFTLPPPNQGSAAEPSGGDQPDSFAGSP
jgi:hypothetical protein